VPYTYLGSMVLTYPDYVDTATGRMLLASPLAAQPYGIRVASGAPPGLPVPPGDGRWAWVPDDAEQVADLITDAETIPAPDPATEAAMEDQVQPAAEQPQDSAEDDPAPGDQPEPDGDGATPEGNE
jgi:hypothetical protein